MLPMLTVQPLLGLLAWFTQSRALVPSIDTIF
jgi:hypothetical protein